MPITAVPPLSLQLHSPEPQPEPAGSVAVPASRSFSFGDFVLVPEQQSLRRSSRPVRIGGRALDLLTALVERPGELVDKRDLVSRAWPNVFVDAGNLKVNMAALRKALGESRDAPQFIATVVGRGYRFIAPVRVAAAEPVFAADRSRGDATRIQGLLDALDDIRVELQQLGVAPPAQGEGGRPSVR